MQDAALDGRLALVTGGSRGIGRAIAVTLARAGARVVVVGRDQDALAATSKLVTAAGGSARRAVCDVTDPGAVARLAGETLAGEPIDVLVNNAGGATSAPFLKTDPALWERMITANLTSTYLVTRAFLPAMLGQRRGRVINVASTAAKVGQAYVTAYCAAKHGVLGLTRALAQEVAASGVTVNAVCPSYVDTEMTDATVANIVQRTGRTAEEARAVLTAGNPQGRLVRPEEVAAAVLYLASDGAACVNGQGLNLCGGGLAS